MVRPATSEDDLKNLSKLPLTALRPQFVRELNSLRQKIFNMAEPKAINGKVLKSSTFVQLIRKYVDQINDGNGVPDIKSAWDNILEGEAQLSYEKAYQNYKEMKIKIFGTGKTHTAAEFEKNMKTLRMQTMKIFEEGNSVKDGGNLFYQNFKQRLTAFLDQEENQIEVENNQFSNTQNQEIFIEMQNDLNNQNFNIDNIAEFSEKVRDWITHYSKTAKGSNKMDVLAEHLPDILQDQLDRIIKGSNLSAQIKEQDQQIKTLKQQLADSKKNGELQKASAVAEYKKQVDQLKDKQADLENQNKILNNQLEKLKKNAFSEEQKQALQAQIDSKDSELLELKRKLKEAELAAKKKKAKCGCF